MSWPRLALHFFSAACLFVCPLVRLSACLFRFVSFRLFALARLERIKSTRQSSRAANRRATANAERAACAISPDSTTRGSPVFLECQSGAESRLALCACVCVCVCAFALARREMRDARCEMRDARCARQASREFATTLQLLQLSAISLSLLFVCLARSI